MAAVLVTGATGNVGSKVVGELGVRGVPVRAFVRDPGKAAPILGRDVEIVEGDFGDRESIRRALAGADSVFLASGDDPRKVEYEIRVIDEAVAGGVRRIVKLSTVGAQVGSPAVPFDWHARIEEHLMRSGIEAVVLRSNHYMSNILAATDTIRQAGRFFLPAGKARIAMIDPGDVAAAAAAVLTGDGRDGETYLLTGPETITYYDVAAHLSTVTGRQIEYVEVPDEQARQGLAQAGMPDWMADIVVSVLARLRQDVAADTTDTVRALIGREPRSFADFARDHAHVLADHAAEPAEMAP